MPAGMFSGGTSPRVHFGSPTVFIIPASNTGRRVPSLPLSQASPRPFSRAAHRIPPTILQPFMLHLEALLDQTFQTILTTVTGYQDSLPGTLIASFKRAYALHSSQHPSPAIPPSLVQRVHRLEALLHRKIIARLASLATVLQSSASLPVSHSTDALPHLTPLDGRSSLPAPPASHPQYSACKCHSLLPHLRLSFHNHLPLIYYRSIGTSKFGKKWLASLTYKIWRIPWVACQELPSWPIF
jgi:hypothetical protein